MEGPARRPICRPKPRCLFAFPILLNSSTDLDEAKRETSTPGSAVYTFTPHAARPLNHVQTACPHFIIPHSLSVSRLAFGFGSGLFSFFNLKNKKNKNKTSFSSTSLSPLSHFFSVFHSARLIFHTHFEAVSIDFTEASHPLRSTCRLVVSHSSEAYI